MNSLDKNYIELLNEVKNSGIVKNNRTGIDTISSFSKILRIDLTEGFPILTTRKIFFRGVFEEMQFFLRGETDTKKLEEKGVNYWKGNTSREFLNKRNLFYLRVGDMGRGYGWQFRKFGGNAFYRGVDQLAELIKGLKEDPNGRRHIISLWNPNDLPETALPPCHLYSQFYCDPEKKDLSCFFLMRSTDLFLGLPTNIIQYALLTHYLAKLLGYTAKELVYSGVDAHLYVNSLEALEIQSKRGSYDLPQLIINKDLNSLDDILNLEFTDIELKNYQSHKNIKVEMVV